MSIETKRVPEVSVAEPVHTDESGSPRKMSLPVALIKAIRPTQATKNLFVYAAIVFAGKLFKAQALVTTTLAFFLFVAVAGSIYILNDILDVEQDRLHPKKRNRPIASGSLPVSIAWVECVLLGVGGLGAVYALRPMFAATLLLYFVLQIAYCFWLKHVVLLDVFVIASGFVLRTVAGAAVINVHISHWLMLCTLQLALFMGFGKRRQELVLMGTGAGKHRAILEEYSLPFLDQLITIVTGLTIACYSVYTVESDTAHTHQHLWITVPFVIYAVCRYLYLVYQKGWGGAPEDVLRKDRSLQMAIVFWFLTVMALFKFDVVK